MAVMVEQISRFLEYKKLMRDPKYKKTGALSQKMNLDV